MHNTIQWLRHYLRLRKFNEYGENTKHPVNFQYKIPENYFKVQIMKELKLGNLKRFQDDFSKIIFLMNWIHTSIYHDGYSNYDGVPNVLSIYQHVSDKRQGVNCKYIAIAMRDLLLIAGFSARYVICMPLEENFDECHVGNIVHVPDLKKWIFIDPTFNTYIMDKFGNILDVKEIRKNLSLQEELHVCESISWNLKPFDHKEYLSYMTKNMFRFACPLINEWHHYHPVHQTFVCLHPKQHVGYTENAILNYKTHNIYTTTDETFYWELPISGGRDELAKDRSVK